MLARGNGGTIAMLGALLALAVPLQAEAAHPTHTHHSASHAARQSHRHHATTRKASTTSHHHHTAGRHNVRYISGTLQCVPFARNESGVQLVGNARTWWEKAAGLYERGHRPEVGSVLTFRPNGRMPLGHVAVVIKVLGPREIEVDHANWPAPGTRHGRIWHNMPVIDVSADNDWSAVRVGLGRTGDFGSVYQTYGFIYDRPARGPLLAAEGMPTPDATADATVTPAMADLTDNPATVEEVAEAPEPVVRSTATHHKHSRHHTTHHGRRHRT